MGHEQALVYDRVAGEAAQVKVVGFFFGKAAFLHGMLDNLADDVELALQLSGFQAALTGADEHLANERAAPPGVASDLAGINGNIPPAQQLQSFAVDRRLEIRVRAFSAASG